VNNWSVVGTICFSIAFVLLFAGIGLGFAAMSAINPLSGLFGSSGDQLKNAAFMAAATPYFVGSAIMFVIGIVGMVVGSAKDEEDTPISKEPLRVGPGVSQIRCGKCGTLNDLDAVYCKKCGSQLR
jgi:hypothetical protein